MLKPVLSTSPVEGVAHGHKKPLYFLEIDLGVAGTLKNLKVPGNMIYIDQYTTGIADLSFSDPLGPAFPIGVNSAVRNFLYSELYLSWSAQAGKVLRIWYGWDADIIPPNQDISNIGSIGIIDDYMPKSVDTPYYYVGAAVTLQTIVTPAANTNGILVLGGGGVLKTAATTVRLMSKATAPASIDDTTADTIVLNYSNEQKQIALPVIVPAGRGLYIQKDDANAGSKMWADYEVL
jgi:hypothetical protein